MTRKIKVDAVFGFDDEMHDTAELVKKAQYIEEIGFDGLMMAEMSHDPFLPLSLIAHHTTTLELRTSVAIALARSPMNVATMAHDINAYSKGRFTLGIGSQIKPHVTKRFGMPWYGPAKQMREFIEVLHAVWDCWYEGKPLQYEGECYQHRLMTPEFVPKNQQYGRPKVSMAAVGPMMMKTATQVADGIIIHAFCTEKHFKEVTLPTLNADLAAQGKSIDDFNIQFPVFIASGSTEEELAAKRRELKYRIGFYASTPAYRTVLDTHGWGDLQPELNAMTKAGNWEGLADVITDEVMDAFAVTGEPIAMAKEMKARFGGYIDRVALDMNLPEDIVRQQLEILQS